MPRCKADPSIKRVEVDGFKFPLGVYPVEEMTPRAGYTVMFEAADGGEDAEGNTEWEEWPDRYVFDIVAPADRVEALCRMLFSLMPGRIYPILDVLGQDAYREIDPYISYDLLGTDRFLEIVRECRDLFFDDGMIGFGAMSEDPFFYVFVDEHKIVTVRAQPELKERIEKILAAFDLEEMTDPAGADSAAHEHRGVLISDRSPEGLRFDELVESLKDEWRLLLNVDSEKNVDEDGKELGITAWRIVVRFDPDDEGVPSTYVEVALAAPNLREAEENAVDAAARLLADVSPESHIPVIVVADRLSREQLSDLLKSAATRRRPRPKRPKDRSEADEPFVPDPAPAETGELKAGQIWLARTLS
ncbi:MAG: hypothetical protein JSS51_03775 [Planctomycetes bacterium]|nr:hypothetical protein [Planctomycetota bacterium]